MTVIAFLGAGSVVFTRELLADILSFDELRDVTLALHDIDAERGWKRPRPSPARPPTSWAHGR